MKVLIVGHAGSGKDTVAQQLKGVVPELRVASTSSIALDIFLLSLTNNLSAMAGGEVYRSTEDALKDKERWRQLWFHAIAAYNYHDGARLVKAVLAQGQDVYVGLRAQKEFMACMKQRLFDLVIEVENENVPSDPTYELFHVKRTARDNGAEYVRLFNNKSLGALRASVELLAEHYFV